MEDDPDFVTALARGLRILTCFDADDVELGNGEISQRAGLAPATVARLTHTLTSLGYLRSIPLRRKYALSANVLSIAHPVLASLPERELARGAMKQLAEDTGGSVCLAVAEGLHAVYIEAAHPAHGAHHCDIGTHRPMLDSSVGRALYVAMEDAHRAAVLNQLCLISPLRQAELMASAQEAEAEYQRRGICRTQGIVRPDWTGFAMPVRGSTGRRFAISLGVHTATLTNAATVRRLELAVAGTASRIESTLKAAVSPDATQSLARAKRAIAAATGPSCPAGV